MAAPKRPNADKVVDAAMALAAERRWREVSLGDIADAAGMGLADLHGLFSGKSAILGAFTARVDAQVIAGTEAGVKAEPVRDRLFDVLVRRFEALRPYRSALGSIIGDTVLAPETGLAAGCRLMRSMTWSLETAGIGATGPIGRLRTKGLAAIYLVTLMVFLRDDSPDLARTMASLDRALGRADALMSRLRPFGGRRPGQVTGDTVA